MSKNILITGGSGMIGMKLSGLLIDKGHNVAHLTRSKSADHPYRQFEWDVKNGFIEEGAMTYADIVIHLAGAGVADKRWSDERKRTIIDSRTKTADLLFQQLKNRESCHIDKFISASAIGYYGMYTGTELLSEEDDAGQDFLAEVVVKWEAAADKFKELDIAVSKLRVGIVLAKEGGALPQLAKPIKFGLGAPLGSGGQMMSWVHLEDICGMFLHLVEHDIEGTFNGVAPRPVSNQEMTKAVAKVLGKPLWLPNVPSFAMKLALGEMAGIVLGGNHVSCEKMVNAGYQYKYDDLSNALTAIYN